MNNKILALFLIFIVIIIAGCVNYQTDKGIKSPVPSKIDETLAGQRDVLTGTVIKSLSEKSIMACVKVTIDL